MISSKLFLTALGAATAVVCASARAATVLVGDTIKLDLFADNGGATGETNA